MLVMLFSASALCRTAHCMVPLRLSTWPSASPTSRGDTCPERARAAQLRPGCNTMRREDDWGERVRRARTRAAHSTVPLRVGARPSAGPAGRGGARPGRERARGAAAGTQQQMDGEGQARWRPDGLMSSSALWVAIRGPPRAQRHRAGSHNRTEYAVRDSGFSRYTSGAAGAGHGRRRAAPWSRWPWPGCSRR